MSLPDAFCKVVNDAPGGVAALAPRMDMQVQILRNKANPNCTTNIPSLRDADLVTALTGDYRILHQFCANHGFVAVKADCGVGASDMAVLDIVTKVWAGNGDLGNEVMRTLADGRVEHHEVEHVKAAAYRLFTHVQELIANLEGMTQPIKGT